MKQYKLCTIKDFAWELAKTIATLQRKNNGDISDIELSEYGFATADLEESTETENLSQTDLEEIASDSCGWYGLKKIDMGFDSPYLCLTTDYYGGGCLRTTQISESDSIEEMCKKIKQIVLGSMQEDYYYANVDTLLIVEFEKNVERELPDAIIEWHLDKILKGTGFECIFVGCNDSGDELEICLAGDNLLQEHWFEKFTIAIPYTTEQLIQRLGKAVEERYESFDVEKNVSVRLNEKLDKKEEYPYVAEILKNEEHKLDSLLELCQKLEANK